MIGNATICIFADRYETLIAPFGTPLIFYDVIAVGIIADQ
jgi:hypothetical protein